MASDGEGFGLVRMKVEGAPVHPEDMDWEHYPGECDICTERWNRQLEAYNKWKKENKNG